MAAVTAPSRSRWPIHGAATTLDLPRRGAPLATHGRLLAAVAALVVAFAQSPGRIAADTKLDLALNPAGFLHRATSLWSAQAPMGQVQNQAYGYFFPHGAFYLVGHWLQIPAWITQRLWWALLLWLGLVGMVRLARALGIGTTPAQWLAAVAYVSSPRVLTTLGPISSETLPMMLAPWVLTPVVRALTPRPTERRTPRYLAAESAVAIALMGAVNAVATLAAAVIAVLWWLLHKPTAASWRFAGWWVLGVVLACAWWVVPLLVLGSVSPPFLDYIESAPVTTEWLSLGETLRGTDAWTPFVTDAPGAMSVSQPVAVIATGIVAGAGLAGLALRSTAARGRLIALLVVGLVIVGAGYLGELGSPVAHAVRDFLDGPGAPLRNVHKWDPLLRIPISLGIAGLVAAMPKALREYAHPERRPATGAALLLTAALVIASSPMWSARLAPANTFAAVPNYWQQTASWLAAHRGADATPARALVVPGAPSADQLWGLSRDEPLQPLASTPWAVRDAIPLTPPATIRAMDAVQRQIASGYPSAALAQTVSGQGISYVVLRSDLAPDTSRSARPLVAWQVLTQSPGFTQVAQFGPTVGPPTIPAADGRDRTAVMTDDGLRPALPAVTIFAVSPARTPEFPGTGPVLTSGSATVLGGAEGVARVNEARAAAGLPALGPTAVTADPAQVHGPVIVTDTPGEREVDFGRVDTNTSTLRTITDPRHTKNAQPDYAVDGPRVAGQWLLNGIPDAVSVTTSGSISDATQVGQVLPANGPAAAFDGDPQTSWASAGLDAALGNWLRLDFGSPQPALSLLLTPGRNLGPQVTSVVVTTNNGSTVASGLTAGQETAIALPPGATRWVQVKALGTSNGSRGNQFAIAEIALRDNTSGLPVTVRHRVVLPTLRADTDVRGWALGQDLPGRTDCATPGTTTATSPAGATYCSAALGINPEEPQLFSRVLSAPRALRTDAVVELTPRPGAALTALIDRAATPTAVQISGPAAVADPRGSALAAVDGNPGTSWIAPTGTGQSPPALRLSFPLQRVSELTLTPPATPYPAPVRKVAVDLGTGRQIRTVGSDGRLRLDPTLTDHLTLTVLDTTPRMDVNDLGFSSPVPAGIAEITLGPGAPTPVADRPVVVPCATSPVGISVAGKVVRLGFSTSTGALRSGAGVLARPCDDLTLGAGENELTINPGAAFSVRSAYLGVRGAPDPAPAATTVPQVGKWTNTVRSVTVSTSDAPQYLVIPESVNPGWRATIGGTTLRATIINGWQQAFIVPPHTHGEVQLRFTPNTPYRWGLAVGAGLLLVLLVATLWLRRRSAAAPGATATPRRGGALSALGAAAALTVIAGPWGLTLGAITAAALLCCHAQALKHAGAQADCGPPPVPAGHPWWARVPLVVVLGAAGWGFAALARGPWQSGYAYAGWSWWVQAPLVVAVSAVVATALPLVPRRAFSRRRSQRRAGSSTKA